MGTPEEQGIGRLYGMSQGTMDSIAEVPDVKCRSPAEGLERKLEAVQAWLMRSSGTPVVSSQAGPVNIGIIGELVRVAVSQEKRIKALEHKGGGGKKHWSMR